MSDFQNLWAQAASTRFHDPEKQKAFEASRLDTLTSAAVTQAMWKVARARFLFLFIGFLAVPPLCFHGVSRFFNEGSNAMGIVGLVGYYFGCMIVWALGHLIPEGDAEAELHKALQPALMAEKLFAEKWEAKGKSE